MSPARSIPRVIALAAVFVSGCSTVRREVIVSARHPASPDAVEAPRPADSTTLAVEPVAPPTANLAGTPVERRAHHGAPASSDTAPPDAGGR